MHKTSVATPKVMPGYLLQTENKIENRLEFEDRRMYVYLTNVRDHGLTELTIYRRKLQCRRSINQYSGNICQQKTKYPLSVCR